MLGLDVLIVLLAAALVATAVGTARRAAAAARLRRAEARVQAALRAASAADVAARMRELARSVPALPRPEAAALVLACRRTFSREVIPVLVALLTHPDRGVSTDAAQALRDLGSPALRAVWQALDQSPAPAPALAAFLLAHPDWLFGRLLETYLQRGEAAVRQHRALWRSAGMQERLQLLRTGADAVNRLRAEAIARALGEGDDRDRAA